MEIGANARKNQENSGYFITILHKTRANFHHHDKNLLRITAKKIRDFVVISPKLPNYMITNNTVIKDSWSL